MLGLIPTPWHGTERKLNDEGRNGQAAKDERESRIQHRVGIWNVKWLMQLLNPQQEHAVPGATARLSAYLYGGADSEAGRTGMAVKFLTTGDGTHGCWISVTVNRTSRGEITDTLSYQVRQQFGVFWSKFKKKTNYISKRLCSMFKMNNSERVFCLSGCLF